MIEFYEELEPVDPDHLVQGELRSEVMFKEDKKYHVDLKVIMSTASVGGICQAGITRDGRK